MSNKSTQFSSENQPSNRKVRGKSERTKLLEAIKRTGGDEDGFYDILVERAFNREDPASSQLLKELMIRFYPPSKPTLPCIEFDFDENASHAVQAAQILKATADGQLPPDMAATFIQAISNMLKIDEMTDLRNDVEEIKRILNESRN